MRRMDFVSRTDSSSAGGRGTRDVLVLVTTLLKFRLQTAMYAVGRSVTDIHTLHNYKLYEIKIKLIPHCFDQYYFLYFIEILIILLFSRKNPIKRQTFTGQNIQNVMTTKLPSILKQVSTLSHTTLIARRYLVMTNCFHLKLRKYIYPNIYIIQRYILYWSKKKSSSAELIYIHFLHVTELQFHKTQV